MNLFKKAIVALLVFAIPAAFAEKKPNILIIDSYHAGYQWSDGIAFGLSSRLLVGEASTEIFYMDAKRFRGEEAIVQSAESAFKLIQEKKPDLVIVSDDIAIKEILQGHYKNTNLPFVFCGLNWDATEYGLPYKNATGVIEKSHSAAVIDLLFQQAKGNKIGLLSIDALSERRSLAHYNLSENHPIDKAYFVNTMAEWEDAFRKSQSEVDMLFLENPEGIEGWDIDKAKELVAQTASIPIGSVYSWLAPLSLYTITNSPEEQGWWAAEMAMQVIHGTAPSDIPLVMNKEGRLLANLTMANTLKVQFPTAILQTAEIIRP